MIGTQCRVSLQLLMTSTAFSNWVSRLSRSTPRDTSTDTAGTIPLLSNSLPLQVSQIPSNGQSQAIGVTDIKCAPFSSRPCVLVPTVVASLFFCANGLPFRVL